MSLPEQFTVFEVASDLAHFRRPYAITTALTFPIPPRTALCGLVGAVLGLPKNEGLRCFGDGEAVFGIEIREALKTTSFSINLLDTKDNPTFRPKRENPHTPMRYEFIRAPRYRILFSHKDFGPQLAVKLRERETVYTPCLGLAWLIAWFGERVEVRAARLVTGPSRVTCRSPVRSDDVVGPIDWDEQGIYQRIRMPAEMQPDRRVTRYQEYIIETTGGTIKSELRAHWELDDGSCFSAM
jgi:CRISPR-associated protein Cas5h